MNSTFEVHRKFLPLLKILQRDPSFKNVDTVIVYGGRCSFKSFTVSGLLSIAMVYYKWKTLFCRYTMESAQDSVIAEVREKMALLNFSKMVSVQKSRITMADFNATNKKDEDEIDNAPDPQIVFKGIKTSSGNQTANLKSLKAFNCFVLDEAEEHPSYEGFKTIKRSIRRKDLPNVSILILNSTTKQHWIYQEFFEKRGVPDNFNGVKGNVAYIYTTYLDMIRFVPENILADFEYARDNDPEDYALNILGAWKQRPEGVIIESWKYGDFDESLPYTYGLDFGFKPDPDCLVKVAIDYKRKIVYVKEMFRETGLKPDQLETKLRDICKKDKIIADSAENRLIATFASNGLNIVGVKKFAGSVMFGVKLLQNFEIIVHPESTNIGIECNNYCMKNDQPADMYNHAIDPLRYVVQSNRIEPRPIKVRNYKK